MLTPSLALTYWTRGSMAGLFYDIGTKFAWERLPVDIYIIAQLTAL